MTGRVALVTGAGRGIGAATVLRLAAAGWSVLAVDRGIPELGLPYSMSTRSDLDAVVAQANQLAAARAGLAGGSGAESEAVPSATGLGTDTGAAQANRPISVAAGRSDVDGGAPNPAVRAWVADVRDPQAMVEAVAAAEEAWGGLDVAIAVAGVIAGGKPLWEMPVDEERAVLDICLGGVITVARASIPAMLRRPEPRSGRFLAVASAAATKGLPLLAVYCAAKAGVAGLIRSLGAELGGTGVTANAVSPGSTDTELLTATAQLYGLPDGRGFATGQPVGRLLEADEIAAVLEFLAGPGSSAMTGATVAVDGGLSL